LLFQRCYNKIFSGLFKPEVLWGADEVKQVRNRFQPNFQLDQAITRQLWNCWTEFFCHTCLLCHMWHTRRRFYVTYMLQAKFIRVGEGQDQYHSNKTRAVMDVKFLVQHNSQVGFSRDLG
jgi:hypothetical protein